MSFLLSMWRSSSSSGGGGNKEDVSQVPRSGLLSIDEPLVEEKRGHRRNRSGNNPAACAKKTRCGSSLCSVGGDEIVADEGLVALSQLGHGSFGRVYLVGERSKVRGEETETECLSALKAIPLHSLNTRKKIEHVAYERRVLEALHDHPNIISLRGAWRCPNALYLLTEVAWGGELFRHLQHKRRFEPRQVAFLAAEITSALEHAHSRRIAYRDLKPENVLLDVAGHVKLVDFGLSRIDADATSGCRSLCGTPEYMAPETLNRQDYGYSVDFWALGMLVAELLSGLPPYYTSDRDELFRRIRFDPLDLSNLSNAIIKAKWRGSPEPDVSEAAVRARALVAKDATSFVSALLDRNPHRRLGTLNSPSTHPFLARFRFDSLTPSQLERTTPPYDPATIATLQDRHAAPLRQTEGFAGALWTHFGRAPLVSVDVDQISVELAKPSKLDDHHATMAAIRKVGDLPERSRAIRAWTYRRNTNSNHRHTNNHNSNNDHHRHHHARM